MKEQLELKLSEVTALVGELGALPEKVARRSSQRRRQGGLISEFIKPSEEREPRQRHTILEQEGRLPAILEDKHYPRRTLEAREVQALVQENNDEATESPDLGPPPVTHFDDTETVVFNATRSPRRTSMELIEESERSNKPAATTSDSRRKRRTSTLLGPSVVDNMTIVAPDEAELIIPEPEKQDASVQPRPTLKTGAKRKLEVSELEDTSRVSKELDDFIFQRKSNPVPIVVPRQSRFSRPAGRQEREQEQEHAEPLENRSPERSMQSSRKILAPKSTNSPAKRRVVSSYDKMDPTKDDISERVYERRVMSRIRTKPSRIDIPDSKEAPSMDGECRRDPKDAEDRVRHAPKTPAAEMDNIMSPTSTEPSTKQRAPREMAVTNSVEDVLNGSIGRGTRRIRAPVNYAQPNLRDKMRRPGKELVGAVEGLVKPQTDSDQEISRVRSNSVDIDRANQNQGMNKSPRNKEGMNPMDEKERARWQALERGQGGKSEPASPLRDKAAPFPRKSQDEAEGVEDELSNAVSRLSVFDPLKSSPVSGDVDVDSISTKRDQSIPSRSPEGSATGSGVLIPRSRRQNSGLSARQVERQETGADDGQRTGHIRKSASVANLPPASQLNHRRLASTSRSNMVAEPPQPEVLEPRTRNSALARRKSMMV